MLAVAPFEQNRYYKMERYGVFRCACVLSAAEDERAARKADEIVSPRFDPLSVNCPFELRSKEEKNSKRVIVVKSVLRHTCLDHDADSTCAAIPCRLLYCLQLTSNGALRTARLRGSAP